MQMSSNAAARALRRRFAQRGVGVLAWALGIALLMPLIMVAGVLALVATSSLTLFSRGGRRHAARGGQARVLAPVVPLLAVRELEVVPMPGAPEPAHAHAA